MSSIIKQKSSIQSFSAYIVITLFSLFITGVILILIIFVFGLSIFQSENVSSFYIAIFQFITLVILILGIILITLGIIYSVEIMNRIKKSIDLLMVGKSIGSYGDNTGGGLKIIRPTMSPAETEYKPSKPKKIITEDQAPAQVPTKETISPESKASLKTERKLSEEPLDMTLEEALQQIVERYNDPKVSSSFSNWEETLMMTFPDINKSYLFKINNDLGIELTEGYEEDAAVQVKVDSDVYIKMMSKQINPIKAYSSGKLEVIGKMRTLLKLRKLMF